MPATTADFTGQVVVHDPQFDLNCDKLHVVLRPDGRVLAQVIATGTVIITQEKKNDHGDIVKSIGNAGRQPTIRPLAMSPWKTGPRFSRESIIRLPRNNPQL